jgi:hypothetical protein
MSNGELISTNGYANGTGYGAPAGAQRDEPLKNQEHTLQQVYGQPGEMTEPELDNRLQKNYKTYREMRFDPTIAFIRMLNVAPLVMAGWSYEEKQGAPTGAKEFIEKMLEKHRVRLMKTAIEGYIDFGWAGYEVVWEVGCDLQHTVNKIKPLVQDYTDILIDVENGAFAGFRQEGKGGEDIELSIYNALLLSFDVDGTYWYGVPLLENVRRPYESWNKVQLAADRYDTKIAGSHWVIHYPVGSSPYNNSDTDVNNYDIAVDILNKLVASGKIVIPRKISQYIEDLNTVKAEDAWKIEILSDAGKGATQFIERMKYLDALKARGIGTPERAVFEGQFGTKAESEAQADFAIVNIESRHLLVTQAVNDQIVDLALDLNWGRNARGTVFIKPIPLTDEKKKWLQELYLNFLSNPDIMADEFTNVDMATLRKKIAVPEESLGQRIQDVVQEALIDKMLHPELQPLAPVITGPGMQAITAPIPSTVPGAAPSPMPGITPPLPGNTQPQGEYK